MMIKKPLSVIFEAMYHEKYDFQDFLHTDPKQNYKVLSKGSEEKYFVVCNPNKKLRIYHTFLNLFVFEFLKINRDVVFSYRKGFSVYDAVAVHVESKYFFQTDIASFFGSVSREHVRNAILSGKADIPIADLDDFVERILDLVCVDDTLPIGFPSSPPISNAVLFDFDNKLKMYCESSGLKISRYSDDIIVSGQSKESIAGIQAHIDQWLSEISSKFVLNSAKSRYFSFSGKVKILGLMILPNRRITLDTKLKRNLEALLYNYIHNRDAFLDQVGGDLQAGQKKITGLLNYANSVDKEYLEKMRRKFGATVIDTSLHRSFG